MLAILLTSCQSIFDKEMQDMVESVNALLPIQVNDWMWKDSVSYNAKERIYYQYFSYRVEGFTKELFRKIYMNDHLTKSLLLTEDLSMFSNKNISICVIYTFGDGEIVSKTIITPEDMRKSSTKGVSNKNLTEYIYANWAISLSAICPYRIDECTTITRCDFNRNDMEFILYWEIDDDCNPFLEEHTIRDIMKEYLTELVSDNHRNLIELEKHTQQFAYKRSVFPVKVTLISYSNNGFYASESIYSNDVIIN